MKQLTIRKAALKDLDKLLDFEQNIIKAERPFDATLKDGHISYYDIAYMIAAPEVEVIVAESGGEIVGSGYARIQDAKIYQKYQQYAYLGFMYVKPEHRGKGVNKKVIEALEAWCLSQNITEVRLEVYHDNQPAVRAYEKTGFSKNLVEMRKEI
jgi:ribosomal protein S18 acetylase RimI-like enzyme